MNDLHDIIFTTIADNINLTINCLYLYVAQLFPSTSTQVMFIESIMNNYTISFDSWYTERKISNNGRELQVDIGSPQHTKSPKNMISAFQTKLFYKDYVGEESMQPYITFPDMKYFYPFQITDLRHQVDHLTPKRIPIIEEFSEDPANENCFLS